MAKKTPAFISKAQVQQIFKDRGWSKVKAARALGVDNSTLHRWLAADQIPVNILSELEHLNPTKEIGASKLEKFSAEDLVDELNRRGWKTSIERK